ncbi:MULTISPECIES: DUF3667 domain-containing protein [unclassified Sphingomonas]|uniref:DUF3667 domain-containing protein n=1 Tax=unclassified Sphingomonas TaxID=196159 RepID=UPI000BCA0A6A|nr:MAG: hypothetical protein B7Z43_02975 [Sphingomonas sp. 12-62-6]OYX39281.1 MAG: hypothetical protein B7Y98_04895 [Sphingomonas sp. 32-62-10]
MSGGIEAAGDLATGGLIGRAFEPHAGELVHGAHGSGLCLNCGTALKGDFCHQCGQTAHIHRTLASIGHDLLHGVWHFEGKIWTTLPMLFTRPGQLTRRYIAGERARFVSPLALFLFSVFLMFATFGSIGGPIGSASVQGERNGVKFDTSAEGIKLAQKQIGEQSRKLRAERDAIAAKGGDTKAVDKKIKENAKEAKDLRRASTIINGDFVKADFDGEINTGIASLDKRVEYALKDPKLFFYKLQASAYKYSWALIPISIPFIWLLFPLRRDVGPYDHAIFAIYSLSAMTMGAVVLSFAKVIGLPTGIIMTILTFGPPLHMYKQLRGAYGLGRFGAAWRTFALLIFTILAGTLFFIVLLSLVA